MSSITPRLQRRQSPSVFSMETLDLLGFFSTSLTPIMTREFATSRFGLRGGTKRESDGRV